MPSWKRFWLVTFAWWAAVLPVSAQGSGWVLHQASAYHGSQTAYLSPAGLKIVSGSLTTVSIEPFNKICMINSKNKTYMEMTYEQWRRMFPDQHPAMANKVLRRGETETIAGQRAVRYYWERRKGGSVRVSSIFWASDAISLPPMVTKIIAGSCSIPASVGVPLRIVKVKSSGKVTMLDTYRCEHKSIPPAVFKVPAGLTRVKDEVELFIGDDEAEWGRPGKGSAGATGGRQLNPE